MNNNNPVFSAVIWKWNTFSVDSFDCTGLSLIADFSQQCCCFTVICQEEGWILECKIARNTRSKRTCEKPVSRRSKLQSLIFCCSYLIHNFLRWAWRSACSIVVMTWCFYLIGTHPEVEEKMYQEIIDVLGEDGQPTFENHRQLV